jgi:hypothetical protein
MSLEPLAGEVNHGLQSARFREKMARVRHNLQDLSSGEPRQSLLVEFDDPDVDATNDEKRRRLDAAESITSKIETPSARNNRTHPMWELCRRDQSSGSASARTGQPKWTLCKVRAPIQPVDGIDKPPRQKRDVEHVMTAKVSRSKSKAAMLRSFNAVTTAWFRGLSRLEPLP